MPRKIITRTKEQKFKVCYVASYNPPNYVRISTFENALKTSNRTKLFTSVNKSLGIKKYFETILGLIKIRLKHNPEVYILGFRGHEIFLIVKLITLGKPLVFDSFVSPTLALTMEKKSGTLGYILGKFFYFYEFLILHLSTILITDTESSADFQAEFFKINRTKFRTIYVGTVEKLFTQKKSFKKNKEFEVFTYATFLPLHGVDVILDAANILRNLPIHFTIVGGKGKKTSLERFQNKYTDYKLQNLTHLEWVKYDMLPKYIGKTDISLGGPFGGTKQGSLVITGKTFQFLSMGKPVVIGKNAESKKVGFVDKENCFLVEQNNPEALAEKILWAYNNKSKLPKIAHNGKVLFKKKFSTESMCNELEIIIKELESKNDTI